jgi:uncharacterized membrane protein YcaP (DUF421 family)
MRRSRFTAEQIAMALRQDEAEQAQNLVCRFACPAT